MKMYITPAVTLHQLPVVSSRCSVLDTVEKGSPWNCRQTFDHFEKFSQVSSIAPFFQGPQSQSF